MSEFREAWHNFIVLFGCSLRLDRVAEWIARRFDD